MKSLTKILALIFAVILLIMFLIFVGCSTKNGEMRKQMIKDYPIGQKIKIKGFNNCNCIIIEHYPNNKVKVLCTNHTNDNEHVIRTELVEFCDEEMKY